MQVPLTQQNFLTGKADEGCSTTIILSNNLPN